jgi:hypothetical protein
LQELLGIEAAPPTADEDSVSVPAGEPAPLTIENLL